MTNNTRFKEINAESFMGISPDTPLAIVFPNEYDGITVFSGDQETGKSSALKVIEALCGENFPEYYQNVKSKDQKAWNIFEVDGVKYRSKITRSSFKLEQETEVAGKPKWIGTGEDKTLIRKLLPYALSPEILTTYDGEKQLTWLKGLAGSNADDTKLKGKHKEVYDNRTNKNREVKILKEQLIESGGYELEAKDVIPTPEFEKLKQTLATVDIEKVIVIEQEEVDRIAREVKKLDDAKNLITNFDTRIEEMEKQIREWETAIELKKIEIETVRKRKVEGNKYIESNANIPEQLVSAKTKLESTKELQTKKQNVETINKTYDKYKKVFDEAISLTSELDDLDKERLALAKSFTPQIDGFEVELGNIDKPEGLYYNGINISTLSESERYGLCLKIWEYYKIKVVFIENITSLGSHAIEIIKLFNKNGGIVFATMMDRTLQTRKISFTLNP